VNTETASARSADPGLEALVTLLHLQGVAADAEQIRHRLGTDKIGAPEMLRCARDLGLKARAYRTDWPRLARTPLPAIATLRDGGFLVVAKAGEDKVLVQSPLAPRPVLMTRDELLAVWDGRLILMTRRAGLSDVTRRFDITWFLGAIHKYRHLLSEVLVASFFLQLFALVSPLFFQVVIDKVLVHRALSTLDVLVVGLVAISIFETVLGILGPICSRTRPTVSTSNLAHACSTTCWLCRWPTSRRGASAIRWRGYANWRTSAIFSPVRP
jgi:subfamily B ATP-binding cassette protein HlyB/CyaB